MATLTGWRCGVRRRKRWPDMLGFLSLVPARLWAGLALAAALGLALMWFGHARYTAGAEHVTAAWDADKLAQSKAALTLIENRDRAQSDLQSKADKQRSAANAQMRDLDARLAAAVDSLHNRPERPNAGSVPEVAPAGVGCTGAGLFAADAQFLIREAGRADRLRARAETCEAAYSAARDTLASWSKPSQP